MRKSAAAAAAVLLSCGGIYLWHSSRVQPIAAVPQEEQPSGGGAELLKDNVPGQSGQTGTHPKVDIVFASTPGSPPSPRPSTPSSPA